jgi:glycosyltransferase involved in cell wall biosynthesis
MLSVVAICKNEISNVAGFVASWSDVADEIIIVDTGSQDGTRHALNAIEHSSTKVRVFTFPWAQDFSAARNYAASHALGTWILWADMDDRINIASIDRIRKLVRTRDCAYAFQVASDVGNSNWHRFMQVRMYPNRPSCKFTGVVHETLDLSLKLAELPVYQEPEIIVAHLGYADENVKKQKAIRNLDLLLHHGEPVTAEQHAQVGDSLFVLGKFSVGIGYYEQAVRLGGKQAEDRLAEKLIVGYLMVSAFDKANAYIHKLDTHSVAANYWQGELHRAKGFFESARMYFLRAISGTRHLDVRECNGDAMIFNSKSRLKELEALCVPA